MTRRILTTLISSILAIAVLLLPLLGQTDSESPRFVTVAEGMTSKTNDQGITAAYRMFTTVNLPEFCANAAQPARLEGREPPVVLRLGESFPLNRLIVTAVNEAGQTLPPIPITIEVEETDPAMLNLRSDVIADGTLAPVATGDFRFRVRTLCHDSVEFIIRATVREVDG